MWQYFQKSLPHELQCHCSPILPLPKPQNPNDTALLEVILLLIIEYEGEPVDNSLKKRIKLKIAKVKYRLYCLAHKVSILFKE